MTARERGELVERLNCCYKCTSWLHQGDTCYTRSKSNCNVMSGGSACGGVHHKMLHGSGVAFCHKILVQVANSKAKRANGCYDGEDDTRLPDINQPVLLEIQSVEVHGVRSKVMFDNGSSAALVTHSFAEKAGFKGEKISYWLVVVGHESVLRHTTLYTFWMTDNSGRRHEVRAFGIDQITDDTRSLDLSGVRQVFPGAPSEVFLRPSGAIDILIGSMYKNIQPYGGEEGYSRGRLRLVKSIFGCGFILSGTHPSITTLENKITSYAKTLVNCAMFEKPKDVQEVPTMSCHRAVFSFKIPEFSKPRTLEWPRPEAVNVVEDVRNVHTAA